MNESSVFLFSGRNEFETGLLSEERQGPKNRGPFIPRFPLRERLS